MPKAKCLIVAGSVLAAMLAADELRAQPRVRVPSSSSTIPVSPAPAGSTSIPAIPANTTATIGQPTFDPYSTVPTSTIPPNASSVPPSLPGGMAPASPVPVYGSAPATGSVPYSGTPYGTTPYGTPTTVAPPAGTPTYGAPPYSPAPTGWPSGTSPAPTSPYGFPSTGYPAPYAQQPNALFPNGIAPSLDQTWPFQYAQQGPYLRLFQDVRWRQTWVDGGSASDELGLNETELATTMNFPNFFWSGQPLHVSPLFAMDWLSGPIAPRGRFPTDSTDPGPFGMPAQIYAAALSLAWQPHVTPQFWGDLEVTMGVYTDFDGFTTDSVRFTGTGLGVVQLTPTATLKLGVTYLDRVDLKLLPAFGVLWIPNPRSRWDLYFPRPKLSSFLTTFGTTDVWAYVAGEYGGGSWTIGEAAVDRRMDINQINVGGGLEWTSQTGMRGFVEAFYVFNRELVFASSFPTATGIVPLDDAIMVRGGISY